LCFFSIQIFNDQWYAVNPVELQFVDENTKTDREMELSVEKLKYPARVWLREALPINRDRFKPSQGQAVNLRIP
jgi:hypothetical protein